MPLYEYQCDACGNRFEKIQKFSDPPLEACPSCSGTVRKLLSSPAIQFKGSGWYITDYAKKSSGDPKAAKGASDGSSESASEKSSDKSADSSKSSDSPAAKPAASAPSTSSKD